MTTHTAHQHLDAEDVVRLLDGALEPDARLAAQRALDSCDVCRARAHTIRQRGNNLGALLSRTDFATPDAAAALAAIRAARRLRTRWQMSPARLRLAAAIALVVLGGAIMVTPASAWLARVAERAWQALTGDDTAPPPPTGTPSQPQGDYRYAPAAGVLTLRFAAASADTIVLSARADDTFALSVTGGAVSALLLPNEVQIDNSAAQARRLETRIPTQVTAVQLIIGDASPVMYTRAQLNAGITRALRY